jgi:hypothetical protein
VGEELCIYYGPDDKLWFDYPKDPEDDEEEEEDEGGEGDPEAWLRNVGGSEDEGEGHKNLAVLESALSPEAFAALQSHLNYKKGAEEGCASLESEFELPGSDGVDV